MNDTARMLDRRAVFVGALLASAAVLLVVGAAVLLIRLRTILFLFVLAVILSSGLAPIVSWVRARKVLGYALTRTQAALMVVLATVLAVWVIAVVLAVPAGAQVGVFLADSNEHLYRVSVRWGGIQGRFTWLPDLRGSVDRLLAYVKARTRPGTPEMAQLGLQALRTLGGVATVLVATLYMLIHPPRLANLVVWIAPTGRRFRMRAALVKVTRRFQQWVRAQIIVAVVVGLTSLAAFAALGMPYPHLLAVVAAFGEFIPAVGPAVAGVVAILVALFQSPTQAAGVAVAIVAIQMLESYFLVPHVMRQIVGVTPLATVFGLVAGFELFGPAGAMLAVPAVAAIEILIPELAAALASTTPLSDPADLP